MDNVYDVYNELYKEEHTRHLFQTPFRIVSLPLAAIADLTQGDPTGLITLGPDVYKEGFRLLGNCGKILFPWL